MSFENEIRALHEYYMEQVHGKVDKAREIIESLSIEIQDAELSEDEWRRLDELAVKALIVLDEIE